MGIHTTPGLIFSAPLAGGDDGTAQTISMIRALVDDAWKDPFVNRTAIEIIRNSGAPPYDKWSQIHAIYDYAHSFYFVNDPITKEALRPTRELLELKAGDCDDINANVLPALLGTIGYETRLVTIAADPNYPDSFSHVYCEVFVDGEWWPLDAARPGAVFGVAPPNFYRREWWSLVDSSHSDYSTDAPGSMAGYSVRGIRGLGSVATDISQALTTGGGALTSVGGQMVQSAIQPAQGPGGAMLSSPPSPAAILQQEETDLLILLGAFLLIGWGLSQ